MKSFTLTALVICTYVTANCQLLHKDWKEGYYYNSKGEKISGLIVCNRYDDRIRYRADKKANTVKIDIKDLKAVILSGGIGKDSVSVQSEEGKQDKLYFAQKAMKTPTGTFYMKFKAHNSGGVPMMGVSSSPTMGRGSSPSISNRITWSSSPLYSGMTWTYWYEKDGTTYPLTKSNYKQVLSAAFVSDPDLVNKINTKKYKFKEMDAIFAEYKGETKK